MTKISREPFPLAFDQFVSGQELIERGSYEYHNPLILSNRLIWSDHGGDRWFQEAELICFGESVRNIELQNHLVDDEPKRFKSLGARPAGMRALATLRIQYPGMSLADPIVALGACSTGGRGESFVGCLFEFAGEPNLGMIWRREVWSARYRFLVVPSRESAKKEQE